MEIKNIGETGIKLKVSKEVITNHQTGGRNGELFQILNSNYDSEFLDNDKFSQIYMTTLRGKVLKGFHVHEHKIDNFFPVMGHVIIFIYAEKLKHGEQITKENFNADKLNAFNINTNAGTAIVKIPTGYAHGIMNLENTEARVCNYCYPGYNHEKHDQWNITDPYLTQFITQNFKN